LPDRSRVRSGRPPRISPNALTSILTPALSISLTHAPMRTVRPVEETRFR
jgi:hypothetical protein